MNFVPRIEEIAFSIARHVHSGDRWKAFNDRPVSLPRKEVAILDPALLVKLFADQRFAVIEDTIAIIPGKRTDKQVEINLR